jgi:hypothetical protein
MCAKHFLFGIMSKQIFLTHNLPPPTIDRWEKSRFGWVKRNVDVAFSCDVGATTTGASFRDYVGNFVVGFTQR